jgi:hypothetical protein
MRKHGIVRFAAALWICACSGSGSQTVADDPAHGGGADVQADATQFGDALAEITCDRLVNQCCPEGFLAGELGDDGDGVLAKCLRIHHDTIRDEVVKATASGRLQFDKAAAGACLDVAKQLPCSELAKLQIAGLPAACIQKGRPGPAPLTAVGKTGESCSVDWVCAESSCDPQRLVCFPPPATTQDAPCTPDPGCTGGLYCHLHEDLASGECRPLIKLGQSCDEHRLGCETGSCGEDQRCAVAKVNPWQDKCTGNAH